MPTDYEIVTRLLYAALMGGLIGFERELHSQPAGLRTHIILTIGSAIAMILSVSIPVRFNGLTTNGDPSRIAAQVISGIGFLGAGAIFRHGLGVKGLTTAASLWTTAIIGMAIGLGEMTLAFFSTVLVLFVLIGLDLFEKRFMRGHLTRAIYIKGLDRPWMIKEVKKLLATFDVSIKAISFSKDIQNNQIEIETIAKVLQEQDMDKMIGEFSRLDGITMFKIS